MLESIDLSGNDSFLAAENGFIWQSAAGAADWLSEFELKQGDGLAIEFSFTQLPDTADAGWAFSLAPLNGESSALRFNTDGLSARMDGQQESSVAFEPAPDWQPDVHYTAFLHLNTAGGLDLRLWAVDQPDPIHTASLPEAAAGPFNLAIESGSSQTLIVYRIWKLENTVSAKAQTQASQETFASMLADYTIRDTETVEQLNCADKLVGEDGTFTWEARANQHCDLFLQPGQALAFDFVLAQPARDWPGVVYLMLDANLENSNMPVKSLGVTLANAEVVAKLDHQEVASVPYQNSFEFQPGQSYSALILMGMDGEIDIQIWPSGQPDQRMTARLNGENVPSTWIPLENEDWQMGVWVSENQQITLSNLSRFSLAAAAKDSLKNDGETGAATSEENETDLESWPATGVIPNLGEFFVSDLSAYDSLSCNDMVFASNAIDLPAQSDQISSECQINLSNDGQSWITEFTFQGGDSSEDVPHLLDFALINRDDGRQRLLRYTPHFNDVSIKVDDQYLDAITLDGELDWVAGKSYTLVIISQYDKYFFVWPSDDPSNKAALVISGDLLREYFGEFQPDALWQLRIWQGAGVDVRLDNMYRFSAN